MCMAAKAYLLYWTQPKAEAMWYRHGDATSASTPHGKEQVLIRTRSWMPSIALLARSKTGSDTIARSSTVPGAEDAVALTVLFSLVSALVFVLLEFDSTLELFNPAGAPINDTARNSLVTGMIGEVLDWEVVVYCRCVNSVMLPWY